MLLEAVFAIGLRHPLPPPPKPKLTSNAPSPTFSAPKLAPPSGSARVYARGKVGPGQFACLDPLWQHESGWRPTADNHGSTAYGIPQLMGDVLRGVSPRKQVDAGLAYIDHRYGSSCAAWGHWLAHHWY